jgi:hypothetical protein
LRKATRPLTCTIFDPEKAFNDKENAIIFICDTFAELLNMLHESVDRGESMLSTEELQEYILNEINNKIGDISYSNVFQISLVSQHNGTGMVAEL